MPPVFHPSRESVTTIREDGSRRSIHPADVSGRFTVARRAAALALIAVYALLPWIRIGGYPAVFLDVAERRFHLFGLTLAAQDLWLLFFLITGLGFSLFVVTALFGRIWCGWACPHSVFLEHVYRRIERWVQGDAVRRRQLQESRWGLDKALRVGAVQFLFVLVSLGITHLFLAYFVSIPALWSMMTVSPERHWGAFVFIVMATGAIYLNFAWFREQLCIIICPYGRIQSALTDEHTLVIGYDKVRGEPRGSIRDGASGACIDCDRCVRVCPTGIDIRQGLQMECIGCAACVDACDEVMARIGRNPGLVRYDSLAGFAGQQRRVWRPRLAIYAGLMLAGTAAAAISLASVHPLLLSATRMIGAPYYMADGRVRDQYLLRLTNKRGEPANVTLAVDGPPGITVRGASGAVVLAPMGEETRPLIIEEPLSAYHGAFEFRVRAESDGSAPRVVTLQFLGPDSPPR